MCIKLNESESDLNGLADAVSMILSKFVLCLSLSICTNCLEFYRRTNYKDDNKYVSNIFILLNVFKTEYVV